MNIIDNAVRKVCGTDKDLDPNSREFMLAAFESTPHIPELYANKNAEEMISDYIMEHSETYTQMIKDLVERMNDERVDN